MKMQEVYSFQNFLSQVNSQRKNLVLEGKTHVVQEIASLATLGSVPQRII